MAFLMLLVLIGALISPELVANSVYNTIIVCVKTIIPTLFVYIVITDYLMRKNVFRPLERILEPVGSIIGIGGAGITVFLLGMLCGFPIGSKLAVTLYEQNRLNKKSAEFLNLFSNNASLAFIFGVVSRIVGREGAWIVFISQFVGSVFIIIIFKVILHIKKEQPSIVMMAAGKSYEFTSSVVNGGTTMLNICASIIVFSFFGDAIVYLAPKLEIVKGIFEFSSGVLSCSAYSEKTAILLTTFFTCFGGMSVFSQVSSITRGKLSAKLYLPAKLLQAVIACLFCMSI